MPRVDIPIQTLNTRTGTNMAGTVYVPDTVNGHSFENTGREFLFVSNNFAGTLVVTVKVGHPQADGQAIADKVLSIPITEWGIIGPFPPDLFNQAADRTRVYFDLPSNLPRLAVWRLA